MQYLQNYINAYFKSKPELYKKYLLSENHDLRVFCIANLIKNEDFQFVVDNFSQLLEIEDEKNIVNFVNIVLSLCDETQKKKIISILALFSASFLYSFLISISVFF